MGMGWGGADEKQNEYTSLRTRSELATGHGPCVGQLSRRIEIAKAENQNLVGCISVANSHANSGLCFPRGQGGGSGQHSAALHASRVRL